MGAFVVLPRSEYCLPHCLPVLGEGRIHQRGGIAHLHSKPIHTVPPSCAGFNEFLQLIVQKQNTWGKECVLKTEREKYRCPTANFELSSFSVSQLKAVYFLCKE